MSSPYSLEQERDAKQAQDINVLKSMGPGRSSVNNVKSAEDFIAFLTAAVKDRSGPEMKNFYIYLQDCFTNADQDLDGLVGPREFDALVDEAAAAPRVFGFAPTAEQMYMNEEERFAARLQLFQAIDTAGKGVIGFPEFLAWAMEHIRSKTSRGAKKWQSGVGMLSLIQPTTAGEFVEFLKEATSSTSSPEHKDLYFHLLRCFSDADTSMSGVIDADGFDKLIDIAAMAPRKFGFAPSTEAMFKSEAERKASRAALFKTIDRDGGGTISFDEFLGWAMEHIKGKVTGGVKAEYQPMSIAEDASLAAKNLPIYDEASSPADFATFCKTAVTDKSSPEYEKMYYHLLRCFTSADTTHNGLISASDFDALVDVAAAAPRKFGFAPLASEQYVSVEERKEARSSLFKTIDIESTGAISFQDFLAWAMEHIKSKVLRGATPWKAGVGKLSLIQPSSADEFVEFLKAATSSSSNPQHKDLYFHLLRCFTDADATMSGVIDADGFDKLIDIAAIAPRKYGFAPSAAAMFKTDAERKESRAVLFKTIDKDGGGTISFDEFLNWAMKHIKGKVTGGVKAEYQPMAIEEDASLAAKNLPIYDEASSPSDFATFCKTAVTDKSSPEYQKMYYHLLRCFSDADVSMNGRIRKDDFDALVDVAAAAPRKFGFAPQASEQYVSVEERKEARANLFKSINTEGTGEISFQEFLAWAMEHIKSKVLRGATPWKAGVGKLSLIQPSSAEEFVEFLRAATSSSSNPQHKDLYFHLLRCFTDADATMSGVIDADGFDQLIDIAAIAPRKYGFAPSAEAMFKTDAERKNSRSELFKSIDKDGGGTISFDEFLNWAMEHIKGKVTGGVKAEYQPMAIKEDSSLVAKNLPIYDDASSPADFAAFCKKAATDKSSPEHQQLYYHLLRCFSDADASMNGRIKKEDFDALIDVAAAAPRKFGFAPHASEMFSSVQERKDYRANLFRTINTEGTGEISFQEFLAWAMKHINGKVSHGVQSWAVAKHLAAPAPVPA